MNHDAAKEFFDGISNVSASAEPIMGKTIGELEALNDKVGALAGALPLPYVNSDQRKRAVGARSSNTAAILSTAARIASKSPAAQQAIGASPKDMENVALQGIVLRDLMVRAEDVESAAGQGAMLLSGQINQQTDTLSGYASRTAFDMARLDQERADVESAFSAALLLQAEQTARQNKTHKKVDKKIAPAKQRLEAARQAKETLDTINKFLATVKKHDNDNG